MLNEKIISIEQWGFVGKPVSPWWSIGTFVGKTTSLTLVAIIGI